MKKENVLSMSVIKKIIDYEAIIKDLKKANEYYIRKENCATPVKECDDHDSSYPPTKVK